MKQLLRRITAAAICVSVLLLCSCEGLGGADNILSPPRLTRQQDEIQGALETALGTNDIFYRYPITGKYRTAITMHDIYGDSRNEAIVLYRIGSEEVDTRIHILTQDENGWVSLCDISPKAGNSVERIDFSQLRATGYDQLLVGWRLFNGNTLSVYDVHNGNEDELISASYTNIATLNLDGYEDDELVIFSNNAETGLIDVNAYDFGIAPEGVQYFDPSDVTGGFYKIASTYINGMTSILQVSAGRQGDGTPAITVDGQISASTYITELICFTGNRFVVPFYAQPLQRSVRVLSCDIDNDGVTEIPVQTTLPTYENLPASERLYVIDWQKYRVSSGLSSNVSTIVNTEWGYYFKIKPEWMTEQSSVTVDVGADNSVWTIRRYSRDIESLNRKIVTIRAYIDTEWAGLRDKFPNQHEFRKSSNIVYTAEIFNLNDITESDLDSLFMLIG